MCEYIPCHVCGVLAADTLHEPIHGNGRRKLSIKYGLQIPICNVCHDIMHREPEKNERYKVEMQEKFENEIGTRQEFMTIFGRNYL